MEKVKIILASLIGFASMLPFKSFSKSLKQADALPELVKEVFEEYRQPARVMNVQLGTVVFSDTAPTHTANGSPDITIKLSEIDNYTRGGSSSFKKLFIQFIIAHEIGHKIQHNGYRREVIDQTQGEGSIFLECDADILAGLLMTDVVNTVEVPAYIRSNPSFDLASFNKENTDQMFQVYSRIFAMDQANTYINSHPSHLQRLMAIKDGIMMGMCTLIAYTDPSQSILPQSQIKNILELYKNIAKAIDFSDPRSNNPFNWAHSEAIRITHENNEFAKNLVRYRTKVKRIHGNQPYFQYTFMIYNENRTRVRFAGRVYTALHARSDREDASIIKKIPLDGTAFDRTIEPGQSIEIFGQLEYETDRDYTTDLVLPGDQESLYFVFDAANPTIDKSQKASSDNNFKNWTSRSLGNIDDHIKDILDKRENFYSYIKGIGISNDTTQQALARGSRYFEPTFKAGMESDQEFVYSARRQRLTYKFNACESMDSVEVRRHFYDINQKIQSSFNGIYKAHPTEEDELELSQDYTDKNDNRILSVAFRRNYSGNDYCVEIHVYGSDKR